MTKSVALEHRNSGICVNTVAPGPTVTVTADRFRSATQANDLPVATAPLGRRTTPEEMANAIVFISSYIGGAVFEVDGGLSAQ